MYYNGLRTQHFVLCKEIVLFQSIRRLHCNFQNHKNFPLFFFFFFNFQPDISTYHSNLVPVLIEFMERAITSLQTHPQEKTGITKIFYALETFCEHLGTGLVPYLSTLMEKLFCAISMSTVSGKSCDCHVIISIQLEDLSFILNIQWEIMQFYKKIM